MNLFDALSAVPHTSKKSRQKPDPQSILKCTEYINNIPAGVCFSRLGIMTANNASRRAAEEAIRELLVLGYVVDTRQGVKRYLKK